MTPHMLNNRQVATLVWLAIGAAWALSVPQARQTLAGVARSLTAPKLLLPLVLLLLTVVGLVWLGHSLELWHVGLLPDTVTWYVGSALVLFFKVPDAGSQEGFFRRALLGTLGLTAFLELYMNLFVLSLPVELLLQPLALLLTLVSLLARTDPKLGPAKKLADGALVLIGLGLAGFVLLELIRLWPELDPTALLLQLALPMWMTAGTVPFLYLLAMYAIVESTFIRIDFLVRDGADRRRLKRAIVLTLAWRLRVLHGLPVNLIRRAEAASDLRTTMAILKAYRRSL
jgi:hypothetical protein